MSESLPARTCPCCGQAVFERPKVKLSGIQKRLYDALKRRPRTAEELREIAWWDQPNGGPQDWKVIYGHIYLLNRKLKLKGIVAKRPWRAAFEPYHLVPL